MSSPTKITTRRQLDRYIQKMAALMGLKDWLIVLSEDEPHDPDDAASCETTDGQNTAVMYFSELWTDWGPKTLRSTVCHELLHCHGHRWREALDTIHSDLSDPLYQATRQTTRLNMELMVDNIARAWSETLPLPILPVKVAKSLPVVVEEQEAA